MGVGPGQVEWDLSMKTKTHFAFRVDIWDDTGDSIVEHVAGVDETVPSLGALITISSRNSF